MVPRRVILFLLSNYGFIEYHLPAVRPVENSEAICYGAGVGGVVKIW